MIPVLQTKKQKLIKNHQTVYGGLPEDSSIPLVKFVEEEPLIKNKMIKKFTLNEFLDRYMQEIEL
jgi:hypothetical protein